MNNSKYTLRPDPPDRRDLLFKARGISKLPERVDLRQHMSPVVNQYWLNSCTADAIVSGLREYLLNAHSEAYVPLSRLYLYWHERALEGTINENTGAYIRNGMKVLQQRGVCPEVLHPHKPAEFRERPTDAAEGAAGRYRINAYYRIMTLLQLREALAGGNPVVLGMAIHESFETAVRGNIPMPQAGELLLGYHAVLATGYDDTAKRITIRNSFGAEWGDNGYGTIAYDYINGPMFVPDMWVGDGTPRDPWDDITVKDAVEYIAAQKFGNGDHVFDSPQFWHNYLAGEHEYVSLAFRKFVAYLKEVQANGSI